MISGPPPKFYETRDNLLAMSPTYLSLYQRV
jgi:hypothetical protein